MMEPGKIAEHSDDADKDDKTSEHMDLLREARERFDEAATADRENREEMYEDLRFKAGEQWPDEILSEREADQRPTITINRMVAIVNSVTGDMRDNRPAINVIPYDDKSDPNTAKVLTGLIRSIENNSDATSAYLAAADSQVTCGLGHWRVLTEYSSDDAFELDIKIQRIMNPLSVYWDPDAREQTRADARYCFVTERISRRKFRAAYPNANLADFEDLREDFPFIQDWRSHDTIRRAEYWTRNDESGDLAMLENGSVIDITGMDREIVQTLPIVQTRKAMIPRVKQYILSGVEVLEGPNEWPGKYIPIVPLVGEEIANGERIIRHGLIRFAKDPQRMYNYWKSAQAEVIALQPKAPYIASTAQIEGNEEFFRTANTRNVAVIPYNHVDGAPPPARSAPPVGSDAMFREAMASADDIKATTGVYDAALGARSNETSGTAINARKRESDIGTIVYMDNLARSIRHTGRILIDLIPRIYDTARMVRILNEDGSEDFAQLNTPVLGPNGPVLLNDLSMGKYDVTVKAGPSFATKRVESREQMVELIRVMPGIGEAIADLIAKQSDWPGADIIAARLRKMMPPELLEGEKDAPPARPKPPPADVMAKVAETDAKVQKMAAETEGQRLENLKAELELAAQTGSIEEMISKAVAQALVQVTQGTIQAATPQAAPPQNALVPGQ